MAFLDVYVVRVVAMTHSIGVGNIIGVTIFHPIAEV
jgi:hypothetical protein